jgi:TonB family protein
MNHLPYDSSPTIPRWSRRQWTLCILTAFFVQVGLLWLLGDRRVLTPRSDPHVTRFKLLGDPATEVLLAHRLKVQDPTLFASANPGGFSGMAWLKRRRMAFETSDWVAPSQKPEPQFYPSQQYIPGESSSMAAHNKPVVSKPSPGRQPMPVAGEPAAGRSYLVLEGAISQRSVVNPQNLPAWPATSISQPTIVEVTVSTEGEILSARLLFSCGASAADQLALRLARKTRFAPLPVPDKADSNRPVSMQGRLVFHWSTEPQPPKGSEGKPE